MVTFFMNTSCNFGIESNYSIAIVFFQVGFTIKSYCRLFSDGVRGLFTEKTEKTEKTESAEDRLRHEISELNFR